MEFEKALGASFKNAYSWVFDKVALKYYLFLFLLGATVSTILYICLAVLGLGNAALNMQDPAYWRGLFSSGAAAGSMIVFLVVLGIAALISAIIQFVIAVKINSRALEEQGFEVVSLKPFDFVRFLALNILRELFALFSWYDKKFLLLPLAALLFVFGAFSPLGVLMFVPALLLLAAYLVVLIRNSMRLSLAHLIFLRSNAVFPSLKESWNLTCGNALKIFGVFMLVGIGFYIVSYIAAIIFSLPSLAAPVVSASSPSAGFFFSWFASVLSELPSPLYLFFMIYLTVPIYALLEEDRKARAKQSGQSRQAGAAKPASVPVKKAVK